MMLPDYYSLFLYNLRIICLSDKRIFVLAGND